MPRPSVVVNEQTGFAALQSPVLCAFAVCDCLDAGRLRGSLLLRCRVRGRMARAGGCLSEHVELVNVGVADRSRGLHTVSLPYIAFRTVPHVFVTVTSIMYIDRL